MRQAEPDLELASALARLRAEHRLSREALAFRSGVKASVVAAIEDGELLARWDTVRSLAEGLGTSLAAVCAAVESERATRPPATASRSAAGDSGQNRQLSSVSDRGCEAFEEADVFPSQVDVDEAP
jgi:transcriptional regulator with XRE-family HTH domain